MCMEIELFYEDTTTRVWDYSGNTRTATVVPHRERLNRFRFLHRRNQLSDNMVTQIDESFLERTERPFWGPEQTAELVRQNTETFLHWSECLRIRSFRDCFLFGRLFTEQKFSAQPWRHYCRVGRTAGSARLSYGRSQ